jgi:hypothetical protein
MTGPLSLITAIVGAAATANLILILLDIWSALSCPSLSQRGMTRAGIAVAGRRLILGVIGTFTGSVTIR